MMKLMKTGIALITIIGLLISLSACGNNSDSSNNDDYTEIEESIKDDVVENETENSELALKCDAILASGYDKDNNFFELVGNETEDYEGTQTEIGVVKNGKWSVEMSSDSEYIYEGLILGGHSVKEAEDLSFEYIGNGCFFYSNIIFNGNKNLYFIGAYDIDGDGMHNGKEGKKVPVVSSNGCIETDDYSWGAARNQVLDNEKFLYNDKDVLLFDNGSCSILDTDTMKERPIKFTTEFKEKDPQTEGYRDEAHDFYVYPYSEGLIGIADYNISLGNNRDGFYDENGKRVIDLSKYNIKKPNNGLSAATLSFVDGKCTFVIINDQDNEYEITINKKGKVINSTKIEEDYEDEEDY